MQGILIFLVLVCKRSVIDKLKLRLGIVRGEDNYGDVGKNKKRRSDEEELRQRQHRLRQELYGVNNRPRPALSRSVSTPLRGNRNNIDGEPNNVSVVSTIINDFAADESRTRTSCSINNSVSASGTTTTTTTEAGNAKAEGEEEG